MSEFGGTLYDSGFGQLGRDVLGGSLKFEKDGTFHQTVYGDGGHFSWDTDGRGNVWGSHFVDDGYPKGSPDAYRFPFGRS